MADYNHCLAVVYQELLEPADRLDVEVVGRLVEQQHIGVTEQHLRKLDTHTPATAELACLTVEILAFEAKTQKGLLHILLKVSHVDSIELLALCSHLLDESHIIIALVVGARSKLIVHTVQLRLHLIEMGKSLRSLLEDSTSVLGHQVLRKIRNDSILRGRHHTARSSAYTCKNLKQSTLSRTVLAHKSNTVLLINHKRDIAEERSPAKLNRQTINRYHIFIVNLFL